jgi:glycosyltransferase involved in cell wall biosynthesis
VRNSAKENNDTVQRAPAIGAISEAYADRCYMSDHMKEAIVNTSMQISLTEPLFCQENGPAAGSAVTRSRMDPLVTLALTTLNRPDRLRETLPFALAQDYPNLEILVSDNGSRDETPALAQALIHNDPRARFRRNDTTVPIHRHFTQCVEAAQGEFFILLHDDDRINSSFVSELVAVAIRHPEVNVVLPANATIDGHDTVVEEFAKPEGEVFDGAEIVCNWLFGRGPQLFGSVVTVLARTDVLRRFGGYQGFAGGRNIDNLLFLQCAVTGRVGFASGAVFNWRIHDSYGSNVTPKQIADSSCQFLRHLRHDPHTVKALASLTTRQRKEIIDGVRYMTAVELVFHIKFLHKSVWLEVLSNRIPIYRWDRMFCFVVLRHYYRNLRGLFHSLTARILTPN